MTIHVSQALKKGMYWIIDDGPYQMITVKATDLEQLRVLLNARHGEKLRRERRAKKKKGGK